ncbi:group 1 glycosyl transferase [Salinisphaera dokdonensis CL-ES53]|uniref:Group 1 glycosyl transferase n=1 Tax=Salinisphaera dokdonensis CL-ES53 TaxID=1304272 RepID=A0ABV2B3R0_9GAMM
MTTLIPKRLVFIVAGALEQPTGGYRYDARIIAGLQAAGWQIDTRMLDGHFPCPDETAHAALDTALSACADDATVVIDGLACGGLPEVIERHAARLTIIVLVHHPLCDETGLDRTTAERLESSERRVLACARRVIVTSIHTRDRLQALKMTDCPARVAEPGVDTRDVQGTRVRPRECAGGPWRLLCVATLIPRKGHDVLLDALAQMTDLDWHCDLVGSLDRDPAHARDIEQTIFRKNLADRITLHGALDAAQLEACYAAADVFVLASHYEGYGMVVTEAIAAGLPVVTTTGGALADTLPAGAGCSVTPGDATAFARSLRRLMTDRAWYDSTCTAVLRARHALPGWDDATHAFAAALETPNTVGGRP